MDHHTNESRAIGWEYDCPLGPKPYPDDPPTLLPNWMGAFYEAGLLNDTRIIDLALPGSHDSLSYDLSLTVSDDGIDNLTRLAALLHALSGGALKLLPGDLEEFFRMQGKTQQLTLSQQLDNGIRFLDVRIMWEPDKKEWYSIHFMQSKLPAEDYLRQIRAWLDAHPHEVIVIWLSKHGSPTATGQSQYPGVTPAQKHQFWDKYCHIFDGLLQHANETSIFTTPLSDMIEKNHRIVSYVSDYAEFTQLSPLALDAANIQNAFDGGEGVFHEKQLLQAHIDYFKNATVNNAHVNARRGFTLLAMNTASPSWQVIAAAKRQFLHWFLDDSDDNNRNHQLRSNPQPFPTQNQQQSQALQQQQLITWQQDESSYLHSRSLVQSMVTSAKRQVSRWLSSAVEDEISDMDELRADFFLSCHSHIKIPGVDHWCPLNLLDISQLASYYNQVAIEIAHFHSYNADDNNTGVLSAFPNAFYLDAIDYDGTIRVGPQLLDGADRGSKYEKTKDAKYALVDTILAYNARVACKRLATNSTAGCKSLLDGIEMRRSRYPLQRWKEPSLGRHDDWPPFSY